MQWESSITITPPEPAMEPARATSSRSVETSSPHSGSTGAEHPPGQKAFTRRRGGGPPAISMITSRKLIPSSISKTPGFCTLPLTETRRLPLELPRPNLAYSAPPLATIQGTLDSVSTLLISVGRPQAPLTAGKGGRERG